MISVKPDYKNKEIEFKLKNISFEMAAGVRSALFEIGGENTQQTKKFIYAPPKTGRFYPYKGRLHQASAPGESPANRSGFLARSCDYKVIGLYRVEFFTRAPYGNYLEDGTENKDGTPRILPRPYLIRTMKKMRTANYSSLQRHVYDRIK